MLDQLAHIAMDDAQARRLGLTAGTWTLRRAWPRREGHLLLEYADASGRTVAGQWLADRTRLDRVCDETQRLGGGSACIVPAQGCDVLLQADGADRRLPGIDRVRALMDPSVVLVHRPERRAVLRSRFQGKTVYAKVTRPGPSTVAAIDAGRLAASSVFQGSVSCPQLIRAEPEHGVAIWSAVPGVSLHDRLASDAPPNTDGIERIALAVGAALKQLHAAPAMPMQRVHGPSDEAAILTRWHDHLRWVCPDKARRIELLIESARHRLARLPRQCAPIHRDLHDKQILIDADGGLGMIDFDTLALGDPALDLGNLIAHAQLRVVQGVWPSMIAEHFVAALLDAVRPDAAARARLEVWIEAASLRLACVYAFRPRWSRLVFDALTSTSRAEPHPALASLELSNPAGER